ncbi:MAG TPA: hypothetical protein VG125_29265 [Pirellulales bacterium]|jgi:hypothetical protein|nr:hypothetical protein [Pirellulales bacterium]
MRAIATSIVVFFGAIGASARSFADEAPEQPSGAPNAIDGLWQAWWGGGIGADGVGRQPVLGEFFVRGDRLEVRHLPNLGSLSGSIRADAREKRIRITRKAAVADQPPEVLNFAYEIKDDKLTLIDNGKILIALVRCRMEQDPLAHTQVEIVAATGIDEAGELLVTEFTALKGEAADVPYFRPHEGRRELKEATVLLVQKAGLKSISAGEARALIDGPTPVVIAHRYDDRPLPAASEIFSEVGPAQPDSDAVLKTLSRVLRPGTLIFILPKQVTLP